MSGGRHLRQPALAGGVGLSGMMASGHLPEPTQE